MKFKYKILLGIAIPLFLSSIINLGSEGNEEITSDLQECRNILEKGINPFTYNYSESYISDKDPSTLTPRRGYALIVGIEDYSRNKCGFKLLCR